MDYSQRSAAKRMMHTLEMLKACHEGGLSKEERLSALGVGLVMGIDDLVAMSLPEGLGETRTQAIAAAGQFARLLHSFLQGFVTLESEKETIRWYRAGCPPRTNRQTAEAILREIEEEEEGK